MFWQSESALVGLERVLCLCGKEGRYMNMVHGEYVWTCGKYGCVNPPKTITTDSTIAYQQEETK